MTLKELILSTPNLADETRAGHYEWVANRLNERPMVDNPEGYTMVPKPFTLVDIFAVLEDTDRAKMLQVVPGWFIERVDRAIAENDRNAIVVHFQMMQGVLGAASKTAIDALLKSKVRDPDWQAKVPGKSLAMAAGLPKVKPSDVQDVAQSL